MVSGDYCDLVNHRNGTGELVFLVGDVSGKGVAAAMLMSHLHAMFRSPIGIFGNAEFSSTRIQMAPGDFVVLYTDGFSEAQDACREEYGRERLAEVVGGCRRLGPREVIGACLEDLAKFRSLTPLDDDLTLMVVQRAP
ncbi:MAG: PP2C family protein-serine/threonine phosphatase [Bryobacteraceae bacterium]